MMKLARAAILAAAFLALAVSAARAENWPQWRGPFFNGSTTETDLPEKFSPTDLASFGAGAAIEVGVGRLADGGEQLQRRGHRLLGE